MWSTSGPGSASVTTSSGRPESQARARQKGIEVDSGKIDLVCRRCRKHQDHNLYDTTSILKTIEVRWNLQPLGTPGRRRE